LNVVRIELGVKKSKPQKIPRIYEGKIEDAITRAKKIVQSSQDRIHKAKGLVEMTREAIERSRRNRGA
jgi:hypothetical protein